MYLLLFLYPHNYNRLLDLAVIDCFISAELPQPENDPTDYLTKIVKSIIVHSPCSSWNPRALYIVLPRLGLLLTYLKRYPKPFNSITVIYKDGYLKYRRRNNQRTWSIRLLGPLGAIFKINNCQIILYSPYLTIKYYTYINVKVCAFVKSVKYIYKYIYKGSDCTIL